MQRRAAQAAEIFDGVLQMAPSPRQRPMALGVMVLFGIDPMDIDALLEFPEGVEQACFGVHPRMRAVVHKSDIQRCFAQVALRASSSVSEKKGDGRVRVMRAAAALLYRFAGR